MSTQTYTNIPAIGVKLKSVHFLLLLFATILGWSLEGHAQPSAITLCATTNTINYPVQMNQVVSIVGYDWVDKPPLLVIQRA